MPTRDVAAAGGHKRLIVRSGPKSVGEQFVLVGNGPLEVGKLPGKHIHLPGNLVSRSHCRLGRTADSWQVDDQKSTNGLYVNGLRVASHALEEGDVLRVGEYELVFRCRQPAGASYAADAAASPFDLPIAIDDLPPDLDLVEDGGSDEGFEIIGDDGPEVLYGMAEGARRLVLSVST